MHNKHLKNCNHELVSGTPALAGQYKILEFISIDSTNTYCLKHFDNLKETGEKAGLKVSGFFDVLMPGNYITQKKHLPEEKRKEYLENCDGKIDEIVAEIKKEVSNYKKEKHSFLLSYGLHKLAVLEKTEKFIFGDECIKCGKCVDICPMQAIKMEADKPIRDEKKCAFCLGCVNVCPTHALQIGKKTQGNPQYINPYYDGKARS